MFSKRMKMNKNLNAFFDRIYCINLDKRKDRWEKSSDLFNEYSIDVTRVSGIEDPTLPWDGLRRTIIGVFDTAIKEGLNRILILEDDIDWTNDSISGFDPCKNSLPDDWDMFYFSAAHQFWPVKHNNHLFKLSWSTAAHAIGFNSKCFSFIRESLQDNKKAIDVTYSDLQKKLNAYCAIDPIAWQRRDYSDIEHQEKWYPYLKNLNFYEEYMYNKVTVDGRDTITGEQKF
jgi:GR25 family glycosyltransferase involved in LPS biosynthesis